MKTLIVTPLQREFDFLSSALAQGGFAAEPSQVGRLPVLRFPELGITLAQGGVGKAQFAVQMQHLLDIHAGWEMVVCAGSAGGVHDDVSVGDIVVATATIEHDFHNKFGPRKFPRFEAAPNAVAELQRAALSTQTFKVHFGTVASGDEDIVEPERRQFLQETLQALAVAWEGAAGAKACAFSNMPYIEIRGVSDGANHTAATDFRSNLEL